MSKKAVEKTVVARILKRIDDMTVNGKNEVVSVANLLVRTVQTYIGDVAVKLSKVSDRPNQDIKFHSNLLLPI